MSLTDIVSSANLTVFPKLALVLFIGVFIAVSIRTLLNRDPRGVARAAALPLEHDAFEPATPGTTTRTAIPTEPRP